MAINNEKPILDPEPSKPGIPLKKSTLGVFALLVLGLGFVSSLVFSGGTGGQVAPTPVAKDPSELKLTGNNQVLTDEEEKAIREAKLAAAQPKPPARPPVPTEVRRDDNTSALFDRSARPLPAAQAEGGRDLEMEAQTRLAKAVVYDASEEVRLAGAFNSGQVAAASPRADSSGTQVPSEVVTSQIDALKTRILGTQGAQQGSQSGWLKEYAKESTAGPAVIVGTATPRALILRQGKVIPVVLGRQLNSDLPGRITAHVSTNVYDAEGNLLIPMGSALVGQYDSDVKVGQSRLMFAFERLILPNGYSFNLPGAPGSDLAGAAGATGDVNNHFFKMFATSLLIAVLADRTKQPANVTVVGGTSGPMTAAGQVLTDVSRTVLERNRTIPPTITVDQGTRINVEVVGDMVFPAPYRPR